MAGTNRALFFDRDGTLIHDAGYPRDPGQVYLLPGAAEALGGLKQQGFRLVLISNQSGIARGLITRDEAEAVHREVLRALQERGVELDGAYYCPHSPEEHCPCRKPSPGMLFDAARELNLQLDASYMVGDKPTDIEAGRRAGCRTILLYGGASNGKPPHRAGCVAANWDDIVDLILVGRTADMEDAQSRATDLLAGFSGKRVLIVGDVMLDEYVWGNVTRVSPEAPVPVVEVERKTYVPGGAANTAVNVASLGGKPALCGIVGRDAHARRLHNALGRRGVTTSGLIADPSRPTTAKSRIMAHGQQVARIDRERRDGLSRQAEDELLQYLDRNVAEADSCVVSDYGKGVVSQRLMREFASLCRRQGRPLVVDPKGDDYSRYIGATIITPNMAEAQLAVGWKIDSDDALVRAGRTLQDVLKGGHVLITRGAKGMLLFLSDSERPIGIPATARNVFDVTGAGDTVVAVLALGLAAGFSAEQSARVANQAGGIVVTKVGTASVAIHELRQDILGAEQENRKAFKLARQHSNHAQL
ncbi:MAG: D-glycero-beta-D-manno-heptose-7-phosphate kinase [Planctomycetes bacterium]|nr:D-glycero-beta-D-manno-heptose-7-phosphate kinase [Planctomycetota bacterium]